MALAEATVSERFVEDFRARCDASLETVKRIVEHERNPHLAAGVRHEYQDKFLLAEFVTNATLVALIDTLEHIGLGKDKLIEAAKWAAARSVTLRYKKEERCKVCVPLAS